MRDNQPSRSITESGKKIIVGISLPVIIHKRGQRRARATDRTFSSYLSQLIRADVERALNGGKARS